MGGEGNESGESPRPTSGSASGGAASGGAASGGAAEAGASLGGEPGIAGVSSGSAAGQALGGSLGTAGEGGAGGVFVRPTFMLGADISSLPETEDAGTTFMDTDGESKDLIALLGAHGFNYARLRAFVDPAALYGYANPTGEEQYRKAEDYCDTAHTLELARKVKQAGMGFLLDLHYSDNWADPGKQIIPTAWRGAATIAELAEDVESYTSSVVSALVEGGARPDMVQLGNEITPGLLIHVPAQDPKPDQWGNMSKVVNAVNGSTADFNKVATLLKAGVDGVRAVDPSIKIMVHLENTTSFPAVRDWVKAVRSRGVEIDVLGLSCYTAYQGGPAVWEDTFEQLANSLDDISFVIAEYNPEATRANEIMANLPNGRGLGTFFWEPTQGGTWGPSLFTLADGVQHAKVDSFAEFDAIKQSVGL